MAATKQIGLVGLGIWGKKILTELSLAGVETHILDKRFEIGSTSEAMGAASFTTDIQVFKNLSLDGIIIASSSSSHGSMIEELASLSIPLFVEKPLTTKLLEANKLAALGNAGIYVMHIWKYHPGIQKLRSITEQGLLGRVLGVKSMRANWTSPRKDTDSLWNLAIHDLTIADAILGTIPEPRAVSPEFHKKRLRGLSVFLGKDPYYNFEVSNRYPDKRRDVRVFGEKGVAILWSEKEQSIEIYPGDASSDLDPSRKEIIRFDNTPPLRIEIQSFLKFLDGGNPPISDLHEGIKLVQVLSEIEQMCLAL